VSAQGWMIIGIVGFSLAAVLIIVAVLLFIRWKIPAVVGDLTGRTEKKQIQKMRQAKAEAANKVNLRPQAYERGEAQVGFEQEKGDFAPQGRVERTDVLEESTGEAGTEKLSQATDVLELEMDANATTILSDTDVEPQPLRDERSAGAVAFQIVKSVVMVHTSEVIE
jgi:Sec-independent protein translocase protein TatA